MMRKATQLAAFILTAGLSLHGTAADHPHSPAPKQGLLLVAFGTSETSAKVAYDRLDALAKARFTDVPVRWAYTSDIVRRKLAKSGTLTDSPTAALVRMRDEGFTHVVVQSLHVIAGAEFDELKDAVRAFQSGPAAFESATVGLPLLSSFQDLDRVATLALKAADRQAGEAVIFMGHGTPHHPADLTYVAVDAVLRARDPLAFLATVEGHPELDDALALLKAAKPPVTRVRLIPFMMVAGDHAKNDMAGDEADSWKSRLTAAGFECIPVIKGLAETDALAQVWLDHAEAGLKSMAGAAGENPGGKGAPGAASPVADK